MTTDPPCLGAFLNVVTPDPASWRAQMTDLDALKGLHHVEVWLEHVAENAELGALLVDRRTIMHGPFIGLSLVTPWEELRSLSIDRLARAAAIGAGFGARVMTVHPGVAPSAESEEILADRLVASLALLRERVDGALTVAVENMPCRRGASVDGLITVDQCAALIERDPAVRITLDVGHAVQNDDKYQPFLAEHAEAVADIHLHDGQAGGGAHWRLGDGALDLDELAGLLVETRYRGYVTLETLGPADTVASYETARDALHRAVQEAQE